MTKAERESIKAEAQRAAGKPVTPKAAAAEERAAEAARAEDLDDPKTQLAIELPKTIELVLQLPDETGKRVRRVLNISTEFTHEQVYDWNLFEDLQSFAILLRGELTATQFRPGDNDAYTAALTTSRIRDAVRRIVAKISKYADPWLTYDDRDRESRHVRPTEDELRRGITLESGEPNLFAMRTLADILFGMYSSEVTRRKNGRAAAAQA